MGERPPTIAFDEIDSTNAEAHRRIAAGEPGPLWITAARQTCGRGRGGRPWVSERGNLYASYLFSTAVTPAVAAQLGFVAALAVRDTAAGLLGFPQARKLALKWPNDLLLEGAKCAGILVESAVLPDGRLAVIIGCGLNLLHCPSGTPYPVTTLGRHGPHAEPREALAALQSRLAHWLAVWEEGRGFEVVRRAWAASAERERGLVIADTHKTGRFAGLAPDGALLLATADGAVETIHAGDVQFTAEPAAREPAS
jgi:BirA family transcriptional regulator, biotin operon repressor / biotin---[acetyl-CoA-carboxylase] ligase